MYNCTYCTSVLLFSVQLYLYVSSMYCTTVPVRIPLCTVQLYLYVSSMYCTTVPVSILYGWYVGIPEGSLNEPQS